MEDGQKRKQLLVDALAELKLELRNDSVLCADFIAGKSNMSCSQISEEMAGMHWLYNYTTYEDDIKSIKEHLLRTYGIHKGIWRNAAKCAKLYHLSKRVETKWPWLVDHPK